VNYGALPLDLSTQLGTVSLCLERLWKSIMAKPVTQKIKLVSSAGTGYYYVTIKNPRNLTEKLVLKKYDPVVKKHVEFKESKIK
jgi:large subunit ribosomal protein L33